jgi:hypothetical protein
MGLEHRPTRVSVAANVIAHLSDSAARTYKGKVCRYKWTGEFHASLGATSSLISHDRLVVWPFSASFGALCTPRW